MAYVGNYTSDDFSTIVIDGLGKIGVAVVGFATIIGLVLIYRYVRGKKVY